MRTQMPLSVVGFALLHLWPAAAAFADGLPARPPDPYAYAPEVVGDYDWSGVYLGGRVGGAWAAWKWEFINPTETIDNHPTGWMGGGQVGIQKQWDSLLLGVEVSYAWPDLGTTSGSAVLAGASRSADISNLLMVVGRGGVSWQNILAYTKAGYASADIAFRSRDAATGLLATSSSAREQGWVAGLGIEYAIYPHIVIGAEYDYIRINAGAREQIPTAIGIAGSRADGAVDAQAVMARLNFLFAPWFGPPPIK